MAIPSPVEEALDDRLYELCVLQLPEGQTEYDLETSPSTRTSLSPPSSPTSTISSSRPPFASNNAQPFPHTHHLSASLAAPPSTLPRLSFSSTVSGSTGLGSDVSVYPKDGSPMISPPSSRRPSDTSVQLDGEISSQLDEFSGQCSSSHFLAPPSDIKEGPATASARKVFSMKRRLGRWSKARKSAADLIRNSAHVQSELIHPHEAPSIVVDMRATFVENAQVLQSPDTTDLEEIQQAASNRQAESNLQQVMRIPAFAALRYGQEAERRRFLEFHSSRRNRLLKFRQRAREELTQQQRQSFDALTKRQTKDLFQLEDRQLVAELDLREAQRKDSRNIATALRHMEAYISDDLRSVTTQDRAELRLKIWERDTSVQRHESAVKVMRAQQARQTRARIAKHDAERRCRDDEALSESNELQGSWNDEDAQIEQVTRARAGRMQNRWRRAVEKWHDQVLEDDDERREQLAWPIQDLTLDLDEVFGGLASALGPTNAVRGGFDSVNHEGVRRGEERYTKTHRYSSSLTLRIVDDGLLTT